LLDESDQLAVIRGLQDGCRDAWARLYDGYSVDVWRCVARLLGTDAASVADVVQEVFIEAARSARTFDPKRGTLWNWLTGIAHHRAAARFRQADRAALLRAAPTASALSTDDGPSEAIEQKETSASVRFALAAMPAEYVALLMAKYVDDLSLSEISQLSASSVDATKSKLARARLEFKSIYGRLTNDTRFCVEQRA